MPLSPHTPINYRIASFQFRRRMRRGRGTIVIQLLDSTERSLLPTSNLYFRRILAGMFTMLLLVTAGAPTPSQIVFSPSTGANGGMSKASESETGEGPKLVRRSP